MSSAAPSAVRRDDRDLSAVRPAPADDAQEKAPVSVSVSAPPKRKPAKRTARHFVEEPLYLLPSHYVLALVLAHSRKAPPAQETRGSRGSMRLQDSTFELLRGLANLSSAVEDDPLYFDQLLGAAVNIKHAFDLGRMDVINGTIRPRNTSLCHECITTVSSVWRSGPDGPRSLCNACGLRYYKQNQRRALEAKRRETKDAADAAASLAALSGVPIDVARRILSRKDVGDIADKLKSQIAAGHASNNSNSKGDNEDYNNNDEDDDSDDEDDDNENDDDEDGDDPRLNLPLTSPAERLSIASLCQPYEASADKDDTDVMQQKHQLNEAPVYVASLKNILTSTKSIQRDAAAAEYADAAHGSLSHPPQHRSSTDNNYPSHSSSYWASSNHHH
ncbi:hypothetical protein FB639_000062 [Coemansia asiatica]|nr:hypothetical protein FB639_000062 [Coemansia asiatica]